MRTVLFAAASTICLAFAAHSAPALRHVAAASTDVASQQADSAMAQPIAPVGPGGSNCIDNGASLSHAAYTTDDDADCCGTSSYCSQYLSTQMLVQPPSEGHT